MYLVGNVMIDSLVASREAIDASVILSTLGVEPRRYALVTLHRPSNVDSDDSLRRILLAMEVLQTRVPVIFPTHPRTQQRLARESLRGLLARLPNVQFLEPLGYCDFMRLVRHAAFVLTDSGGIQEETTYLNVPCLTARRNTERPVTVDCGTSVLVGNHTETIVREALRVLDDGGKSSHIPPLWDGHAAERISAVIAAYLAAPGGE
jgi:UDP-N-acetylglucosamine 2-epimerase (non-hydrolysing)